MTDSTLPARGINELPGDFREALARHLLNAALQGPADGRLQKRLAIDLAHRLRTSSVLVGDVDAIALIPHLPEPGIDLPGRAMSAELRKSLRAASWMVAQQPCGSIDPREAVAALNEGRRPRTVGECLASAHGHDLGALRDEYRDLSKALRKLPEASSIGNRLQAIEEIFERYDPYDGAMGLRHAAGAQREAAQQDVLEDVRFLADVARTAPTYDDPLSSGYQPAAIEEAVARVVNWIEDAPAERSFMPNARASELPSGHDPEGAMEYEP